MSGRGGARPGAGRPPGDYRPPAARADYEAERARHEKIKADQRDFNLAIARREYVKRSDVSAAQTVALSMVVQALRALPDNLERTHGIDPRVAVVIGEQIDDTLAGLSKAFKTIAGDDA